MKNVELKQQAIAYIEQLSTAKLETALNYLAALRNSDLWTAAAESEKRKSSDKTVPLLSLAGTLECDVENISDRHRVLKSSRFPRRIRFGWETEPTGLGVAPVIFSKIDPYAET
ncbi:hypothetical protein F4009_14965 [Candidatus Poribacteria bacterium]|nr:hypothetical protein [Candidatus Poribacteria bacterium]MYH80128.1 hypothetical protein [Candidatus Poribacteria bacterium]MYK95272.1 hypothetical protein [Candidatus Poribacteria bacterium]